MEGKNTQNREEAMNKKNVKTAAAYHYFAGF